MSATNVTSITTVTSGDETYTLGHAEWARRWMQERGAASHARFLLPHLQAGQRLLDCGCGPGAITVELAALIHPGEAIGIDLAASQVRAARQLASSNATVNVQFEVADAYALPFEAGSFDVVYAQSLLMHLRTPARAIAEMRRVLRPGGLLAVRDPDYGALLTGPEDASVRAFLDLFLRVLAHNGGSPFYARGQRQLLRAAGLAPVVASAEALAYGSDETTASVADVFARIAGEPAFRDACRELRVDDASVAEGLRALQAWAAGPDAYYCMVFCEALGWVPR